MLTFKEIFICRVHFILRYLQRHPHKGYTLLAEQDLLVIYCDMTFLALNEWAANFIQQSSKEKTCIWNLLCLVPFTQYAVTVTSIYASNRLTLSYCDTRHSTKTFTEEQQKFYNVLTFLRLMYSLKDHDAHLIEVSIANFGISHDMFDSKNNFISEWESLDISDSVYIRNRFVAVVVTMCG